MSLEKKSSEQSNVFSIRAGQLSRNDILWELENGELHITRGWEGSIPGVNQNVNCGPLSPEELKKRETEYIQYHLKKASFDISPSLIALSTKTGFLETVYRQDKENINQYYIFVKPGDTVLIVSNEFVECPEYIAGYVTSRVSNVFNGFGHISTTLDPGWKGAPLIALSNPTKKPLKIVAGTSSMETLDGQEYKFDESKALATLTFHYLNTPYQKDSSVGAVEPQTMDYKNMRIDLLSQKMYFSNDRRNRWSTKLRCLFHPNRKAFTDFFYEYIKAHESDLQTPEGWKYFLREFGAAESQAEQYQDINGRVKQRRWRTRKHVCDFVVEENLLNHAKFALASHLTMVLVIGVVLCSTAILYIFKGQPDYWAPLISVLALLANIIYLSNSK